MSYRTLDELFEDESAYPALAGSKSAAFLSRKERHLPGRFGGAKIASTRAFFIGRQNEIQRLSSAIEDRTPVVLLTGPSGVGKTALLNEFLQRQPHLSSVFVDYLRDAWSIAAAGLHEIYGKLPVIPPIERAGSAPLKVDPFRSSISSTKRTLLVFDNFDRHEADVRHASESIANVLQQLRSAIGTYVTVVIASRSETTFKDSLALHRHIAFRVEPFTQADRFEFLARISAQSQIVIDAQLCKAIADASYGLPLVLKSFFSRSEEQFQLDRASSSILLQPAHFCDAIAASFRDVVIGFDQRLLSVGRFKAIDMYLIDAFANFNTLSPLSVRDVFQTLQREHPYSWQELREAVKRLVDADFLSSSKNSIVVKRPLVLPYLRAIRWQEISRQRHGTLRSLLLQLVASARALTLTNK